MPTTRPSKKKPSSAKGDDDDGPSTKRRLDFGKHHDASSSSSTEEKKRQSAVSPSPNEKKTNNSKRSASAAFFSPTATTKNDKKRKTTGKIVVTPEAAAAAAQQQQEKEKSSSSPKDELFVPTYIHKNLGYDRQGQRKCLSANTLQCFQLIEEYYDIPSDFEQCRYSKGSGGPISGTSYEERVIQAYTLGKFQVKPEYNKIDGQLVTIKICSCCADVGHMRDDCPSLL